MSILTPDERRARAEADALLAREYEALKPEVVRTVGAKLAASGVRLPEADLDAVYNLAWHALHTKLVDGEEVGNRTGLLVAIAHRRALDEHRATHPSRRAEAEQLDAVTQEDGVAERLDDVTDLHQFVAGLRERLDRRELEAAALCYVYEYTRPEAARAIGVAPKRMEKIMDAVSKKITPLLGEIRSGVWCEQHRSLMTAYALELLEPGGERHRLAREHLDGCSACRRSVLRTRGIAAVAPPLPLIALVGAGVVGAGAAASAGGAGAAGASAGGHGAGGGVGHGLAARAKVAAVAAAVVVVAAAVAAAFALDLVGGGSDKPATPVSQPTPQQQQLARARAERAARARARARARAELEARARARREAARRRARRAAARTTPARTPAAPPQAPAATTPAAPDPSPGTSPAAGETPAPPPAATPPASTTPAAPPPAATTPEPPARAAEPSRDGAEEFDLR